MQNLDYDNSIVIASKKNMEVIHLAGIGRFCKLDGCGKRITGKIVTRKRFDKIQTYELSPLKNQLFCSKNHTNRYYDSRKKSHKSKTGIDCHISLIIKYETNKPFRLIHLYLKKGISKEIKITPKDSALWSYLDTLSKYRSIKPREILVCQ